MLQKIRLDKYFKKTGTEDIDWRVIEENFNTIEKSINDIIEELNKVKKDQQSFGQMR